jgi:hypothetical protein
MLENLLVLDFMLCALGLYRLYALRFTLTQGQDPEPAACFLHNEISAP